MRKPATQRPSTRARAAQAARLIGAVGLAILLSGCIVVPAGPYRPYRPYYVY